MEYDNLHAVYPVSTNVMKPNKAIKARNTINNKSKCEMDNQHSTHQRSNPSPFLGYTPHSIGQPQCLYQLNIEGASRAKSDYISHSAADLNIDVILLQKTHVDDPSSASRLHINGFMLIAAVYHSKQCCNICEK